MRRFLSLSILIMFVFIFCFGCVKNNIDSNSTGQSISDAYKTQTYNYLISQEHSSWKKEITNIVTKCYDLYKLNCLQNNQHKFVKTNYDDVIVIGNFSLYSNKQQDNYVCFSDEIRIFVKDEYGYWKTNRYGNYFYADYNFQLGRSDFIKYGNDSFKHIKINSISEWTYLGTYGEGVSTYWDSSCVNFTNKDILQEETRYDMWSDWSIESTENWCYRIKGEKYFTYNLQYIIF